ncbi:hypothetical protein T11_16576 [Trichinella zimbabwensis]|uniref:Uncharacterized protein n=1 Tax=Trichinella zimbabwensis TaxID=268475 RepID=A0A0V1DM33_9BILA|nr:hypothetical protein T11_16576 [Trichinella zimbabwensis]
MKKNWIAQNKEILHKTAQIQRIRDKNRASACLLSCILR